MKNLMSQVRDTCHAQMCCYECPLYRDDCLIVKMPFRWDVQEIEKRINEYIKLTKEKRDNE